MPEWAKALLGQGLPAELPASPPHPHNPELRKSSKPHPYSVPQAEMFVLVEADRETES